MRRLLTVALTVVALLLLTAAPAFAQDGTDPTTGFAVLAAQLTFAAVVVEKIVERLKAGFEALKGSLVSVVAIALGFAAAYGFDLSIGADASEFIDKAFSALSVAFGAGLINDITNR